MFTLLNNAAELADYRTEVLRRVGYTAANVNWGKGPAAYPCLVASLHIEGTPLQFASCYVYRADAEQLLAGGQGEQAARPAPETPGHTLADFARNVSANLAALTNLMVETGICTRDRYVQEFQRALAMVDRMSAADRDKLLRGVTDDAEGEAYV